jgi:hypothetical protein
MRASLLMLASTLVASPVLAQQPAERGAEVQVPRELTDPRWADRLVDAMQALSKAFLELPVGEAQAALEGRTPTKADRRRTVRSDTGLAERELRQRLEASKPMMQAGMKALSDALPTMMRSMAEAEKALERATANLPDPTYPKR